MPLTLPAVPPLPASRFRRCIRLRCIVSPLFNLPVTEYRLRTAAAAAAAAAAVFLVAVVTRVPPGAVDCGTDTMASGDGDDEAAASDP